MTGDRPSSAAEHSFRPELEGLRAVAVGLVLLYHAGIPGWTGGYVGVDVFYVLSGFLITGLLVRELTASGTIDLPAFYARRARRLLPAALVALLGTLLLSVLLLPPLRLGEISTDIAAAALYVSNIRFAVLATDYLGALEPPSPVLHYWSLGVEEQFYLVWPALLLGVAVLARRMRRFGVRLGTALVVTITTVGVTSLAASVVLTSIDQPWAFFSLPTRAWELAIGGILALVSTRLASLPLRAGGLLVAAGLVVIVASGATLSDATPFPGWAALGPSIGAALVVAGGEAGFRSVPARFLELGPVRYVGRISYSLYLWHWPILAIPAAATGGQLDIGVRLGLVVVSFVLAAASQRWVEEPIRRGRIVGLRVGRSLAMAGVTCLAVAVIATGSAGAILASLPGDSNGSEPVSAGLPPDPLASFLGTISPGGDEPSRSPGSQPQPGLLPTAEELAARPALEAGPVPLDLLPSLRDARGALPAIYRDGCHVPQKATESPSCVFGDPRSGTTVILYGDSHAAQWFPPLETISNAEHWRLVVLTKSACPPIDTPLWSYNYQRRYTECDAWHRYALERIAAERPAMVLVSTSHQGYSLLDGTARATINERPDLWDLGLSRTLQRVVPVTGRVVFLSDTPRSSVDPPICLSAHLDDAGACATPVDEAIDETQLRHEADLVTEAGGLVVDAELWICPTNPCPVVIGRYLVFRDEGHMTAPFSTALARRLRAVLGPLAPWTQP